MIRKHFMLPQHLYKDCTFYVQKYKSYIIIHVLCISATAAAAAKE